MFSEQRIEFYKQSLEKAIKAWENVAIFEDPVSNKFVQFAIQSGDGDLWVDIPMEELNETTLAWLSPHMEKIYDNHRNLISLQKLIKTENTQYAAEYTEWIFTKIFQLPENHNVTVNIFS